MCLNGIMPKKERNKILDKIDREGLKVYKVVVEGLDKKHYPLYVRPPLYKTTMDLYEGTMEAERMDINNPCGPVYKSGFHFFKTFAAAKRLCEAKEKNRNIHDNMQKDIKYKVIACNVKKSWISLIGWENGVKNGNVSRDVEETIIVAKKAIFP